MPPSSMSVIIPTYNHAAYLPAAIDSVLAQTCPPAEIVVVDDGSTDATAEVLVPYLGRVSVVRQANAGVSAARNAGLQATNGELVAFLDADDRWLPRKLEQQAAAFCAGVGLVHCAFETIDVRGRVTSQVLVGLAGGVSEDLLLLRRPVVLGGGSGFVARRDLLEDVGGFDTALSTSADWDLFYRLSRHCDVGFVPEVLLQYRQHAQQMHHDVDAMRSDMLAAFSKACRDDHLPWSLRRRAYARLHFVLAGSYSQAGRRSSAVAELLTAVLLGPEQLPLAIGRSASALRRHQPSRRPKT